METTIPEYIRSINKKTDMPSVLSYPTVSSSNRIFFFVEEVVEFASAIVQM